MISRNISYLVAASEIIVSYILIVKKTKKIFNFSQKYVAENKKFLSENLKAKAKLKNMKSQECYGKFSDKKSLYIYLFVYLFIHVFTYFYFIYIFFLVEEVQPPTGKKLLRKKMKYFSDNKYLFKRD